MDEVQDQRSAQVRIGASARPTDPAEPGGPALPLSTLVIVQNAVLAESTVESALLCVVRQACTLTGAAHGWVSVVGPDGLPDRVVPASHPEDYLISVPIELRGEVLGSLLIGGSPTANADVTLPAAEKFAVLQWLAGIAAVVIENFRLTTDLARREEWVMASTEITRTLLTRGNDHTLADIARRLSALVDADVVKVVLPVPGQDRMLVQVAISGGEVVAAGGEYPGERTLSRAVINSGEPVRLVDAEEVAGAEMHLLPDVRVGPVLGLPLVVADRPRGSLIVGRLRGRHAFSLAELDMASAFSQQAALALELADTRSAQDRVALWEDRGRIARDLHDLVIQQLFAAGLVLQGWDGSAPAEERTSLRQQVVGEIDEAIGQIRTSIFALQQDVDDEAGTRAVVLTAINAASQALGWRPRLRFSGPIDTLTPSSRHEDISAVLRESLTNVARHAHADGVDVDIVIRDGRLSIRVADNGLGMAGSRRYSGLANLRARATALGGTLGMDSPPGGGTTLLWTIPLDGRPAAL